MTRKHHREPVSPEDAANFNPEEPAGEAAAAAAEAADETVKESADQAESVQTEKTPDAAAELESLRRELAEARDKLLYLQADYQNYRKRTLKDLADARLNGVIGTVDPFLRVFDFLGMARQAAEKSDNIEAIRQGVTMIIGEYGKAFDDLGISRPASIGGKFDPTWQEAVAQEASDSVPEGHVIREWNCAYRMGEKLLRPAKVIVSSGPAAAAEAAAEKIDR